METRTLKTVAKAVLLKPALFANEHFLYTTRLSMACARGALNVALRHVDPTDPGTWEFSAFSQNGEDGIIDQLLSALSSSNRYFVEIGSSDGLENNSACLAFIKKYDGLMIEGDPFKAANAERFLQSLNWSVQYLNLFMTPAAVSGLTSACLHLDPDLFSLDIDGNDFHVAEACLTGGLRPKVICVEYNSAFGPDRAVTIPYDPLFNYMTTHPSGLYYGVSLEAWRKLLGRHGYRFVTVESRGVNAFFVDPAMVPASWLDRVRGIAFAENSAQRMRTKEDWQGQFARIRHLPLVEVS